MTTEAEPLKPAWEAYAASRGLAYYEHWSIPEATQLLHHGSFDDAPNVIIGDLPGGLRRAWLAHFAVARTGLGGGSGRRGYTVVVVRAETSVRFAVRVLCHDRDLPRAEADNPDSGREIVPMDDRVVVLESDAFLRRYLVATDHDQDQVRAWQLFDPSLIGWLTDEAPADFSFELQNGALCCFVPGAIAEPDRLDELCGATARVLARVVELSAGPIAGPAKPGADAGTREDEVERALSAHPFSRPPRSVRSAALHLGRIPVVGGSSRRLGAEAFFRSHAADLGLERLEPSEFLAAHIDFVLPGAVTQVARGRLPATRLDGYLVFATDPDGSQAWNVATADIGPADNGFAFVGLPEVAAAEEHGFDVISNGSTVTVWKPAGNEYGRTAKQLHSFCETAFPLLERAVAAAEGGR